MTRASRILCIFGLVLSVSAFSAAQAASVRLAWNPSSGEVSGYRIYYGTASGSYPNKVEAGTATEYLVTGLTEGKTYYFVTRAYNSAGESGNSNEIAHTLRSAAPAPSPTPSPSPSPSPTPSYVSAKLSWDASPGLVDGYRVYYGTRSGEYPNRIEVGKKTEYEVTKLSPSVTYYFVTRSYNAYGESGDSNEVVLSAGADSTAPLVRISSPATGGIYETRATAVNLAGTAADDQAVAGVTWKTSAGGSGTASGTTSWTIIGIVLAEGENLVTVTARDTSGNQGSANLIVYRRTAPAAPKGFSVKSAF